MKPNPRIAVPVVLVVLAAVVVAVLLVRGREGERPLTASGTVEATDARLGFDVPGRLAAMLVEEGDEVAAGQTVAILDTTQIHAQLIQARAQADAVRARLAELESGTRVEEIAQARARASAAADRLALARSDLARTRILFEGGAVSPDTYDRARTSLEVAVSDSVDAAKAFRLAELGPRAETIRAQRAELARAEAAVQGAEASLALMSARAPFPGVVSVRHREPGETVPAGSPAITLTNLGDRWVRIYVPETSIGRVRLGQKAALSCDTFPGKTYDGAVSYIASEAEFTPKSVQTPEERVKLVYMVKVRILGDPGHDLKPGMPADVTLREEGS